jgi:hypothetical protein
MRLSRRGLRLGAFVLVIGLGTAVLAAARLQPETVGAWASYVAATERRIARELASPHGFLALDFVQNPAEERRQVLAGAVIVQKMTALDARGRNIDVPSALVHHWRGEILIPGRNVAEIVSQLQQGIPPAQEDVLQSRVIERGPDDHMKIYLKLQRKKFVTAVYNTEHVVTFVRHGSTRASSTSTATRIAELENPGTPEERELPAGEDRGFLWRLNAYWRYEEVADGVIAECESISLSRDVPSLVRYLVNPVVDTTARESMTRTLQTLRAHFARH